MKGDEIGGLDILSRVNGQERAGQEVKAIRNSMASHVETKKVPIKSLFKPALRLVLLIGIMIAILQQITGINSVFFYAPMIFEQSGIGTDASFSQAILVGLTNLVFTVVAMLLIDKLGRKPLLGFGVTGIALAMFLLAYGFNSATYKLTDESITGLPDKIEKESLMTISNKTYDSDVDYKAALAVQLDPQTVKEYESVLISSAIKMNPYLILIGIIGFVASFAVSLGPVMWVMFSELFPNWIRGLAISFAGFINSAISFLVQLLFPWELANMGSTVTFLIYGILAVAGLVFILSMVPETKGKSLEELESILVKEHD